MEAPPAKGAKIDTQVAAERPLLPDLPAELWRTIGKLAVWIVDTAARGLSIADLSSFRLLNHAAAQGLWRPIYYLAGMHASYATKDAMMSARALAWSRQRASDTDSTDVAIAAVRSIFHSQADMLRRMRKTLRDRLQLDDRAACRGIIVAMRDIRDDELTLSRYHSIGSNGPIHRLLDNHTDPSDNTSNFMESC